MSANRPTIVLVDDEPEVLHSLQDLFRLDYRVHAFERGIEALEVLDRLDDVHVILSDQRMPQMSGVEFLNRAGRVRPEATRLLLTGYADIKSVIDAINQGGIFRYITKPWDPEELESTVKQAVDQHDLVAEKNRLLVDLTQSNERLVEANRLKRAFIEVASHELNTPVTVLLGMAELWRMSQAAGASPAEVGWVDRIHAAGKRLAGTVERMVKLLRADQFDHPLDLQIVELAPLVQSTLAGLQPFLDARKQRVELDLVEDLGTAEVDPAKFADIITSLSTNAIKFTPDAGTIRISAQCEGEERVAFQVADQGVGIGAEDRRHLFEPFFTGYDTMHHSSGEYQFGKRGIGLGLCLVKTFVKLHGGQVDVASVPGRGSTFGFVLPRRDGRRGPS